MKGYQECTELIDRILLPQHDDDGDMLRRVLRCLTRSAKGAPAGPSIEASVAAQLDELYDRHGSDGEIYPALYAELERIANDDDAMEDEDEEREPRGTTTTSARRTPSHFLSDETKASIVRSVDEMDAEDLPALCAHFGLPFARYGYTIGEHQLCQFVAQLRRELELR